MKKAFLITSFLAFISFYCVAQNTDSLIVITDAVLVDSVSIVMDSDSVAIDSAIAVEQIAMDSASTEMISINPSPTRFFEIGICPISYKGELSQYSHWNMAWQVGLVLARKKRLNGEFSFLIGSFSGQQKTATNDNSTKTPNTYFNTSFFSGSYHLHLNLIAKPTFKLYVSQGFGILNFSPKNANGEKLIDKAETRPFNESYSTTSIIFSTQIGAHYSLKNNFHIGAKITWLNTFTDYLDNISEWGNTADRDNLLSYKFYVLIPIPTKK